MRRRSGTPRPAPLVLIVEDDGDTRELYAEWLRYSGFRVAEAVRAEEAIAKAYELVPDLITADMGLRGSDMDGCQLCERLKKDGRTKAIPVIAVTGWAMASNIGRAHRAGCDSVLIKPCLPEVLLAEIQRLLKVSGTMAK
jgi:two-component system cell cycle response regulator DivK